MYIYNLQALAENYQHYFNRNVPVVGKKKAIVFLVRSTTRSIKQQRQIALQLQEIAKKRALDFYMISDKNFPKIGAMMKILQRAILLVGSHGAGMSNTLYIRPPASVHYRNILPYWKCT